ncbi:MAG: 50S ribosomal protein L30e [Candidatus Heimdallarchaeaceae archaeon]
MDLNRSIRIAVDTGKVSFGAKSATKSLLNKKAKLVIIAENTPENIKADIEYYSSLSDIPVLKYPGSTLDLGATCGRPHFVAALTIFETGDSDILDAIDS